MEEERGAGDLAEEVEAAREAVLAAARSAPTRWWTTDELEAESVAGRASPVFMIALYELVSQRIFELDERFRVRIAT